VLKIIRSKEAATLQWLQNPRPTNGDNLNNAQCETKKTSRNKKREYLKEKINELKTKGKNKNIKNLYRGINEFKKLPT
jgi:hypothetical protein